MGPTDGYGARADAWTSLPASVWVDPRTAVGRSRIAGEGLFAREQIARRTVVIRLGGRLLGSTELAELIARADADPAAPFVDSLSIDDDAHLVLPPGTAAHFANHSCDPTLWVAGGTALTARRDVVAGEELTLDYGTISGAEGFSMGCRCGSRACRGTVSSEDWRRPISDPATRATGRRPCNGASIVGDHPDAL